ncbi:hypothetical protein HY489_00490 [Candidatus Woesearchaeota archaeon]|nr:hypothetical protein [Candidatus Woesearchaeota archaeon]
MRPIVKEDILDVLHKSITAFDSHDYVALTALSNHTIHDASIFQEDDPLTLAVVILALSKVIQRCAERGTTCPSVTPKIKQAIEALEQNNDEAYRATIKNLLHDIAGYDQQLKMYIHDVIAKARVKKASKLHEHGISIARTAELLGISQWELQNYIGNVVSDVSHGVNVNERIRKTRELFR